MTHFLRAWLWTRRFLGNDTVFLTLMTSLFAGVASQSLDWAVFAGFVMFVLLITIREAVETILDELRKAGVLPPEDN